MMSDENKRHLPIVRPTTRADCRGGVRPCPFVACRFNLLMDVQPGGSLVFNAAAAAAPALNLSTDEPEADDIIERVTDAWAEYDGPSCALDVIEAQCGDETGGAEVAQALGVSRQAVDQMLGRCVPKLRNKLAEFKNTNEAR